MALDGGLLGHTFDHTCVFLVAVLVRTMERESADPLAGPKNASGAAGPSVLMSMFMPLLLCMCCTAMVSNAADVPYRSRS